MEKIGKVSSASVQKGTGRGWSEWIKILEKAGARHMEHRDIVLWLKKKYKLTPWWQQGVTHGFELHIGRRIEGVNLKGEFSAMGSRTFPLSQKKLWAFVASEEGQNLWLKPLSPFDFKPKSTFEAEGGIFGELRTMKAPLRARLTWQDVDWPKASVVQIYCLPRKGEKSVLVFMHEKLKDGRLRVEMQRYWKNALAEMLTAVRQSVD